MVRSRESLFSIKNGTLVLNKWDPENDFFIIHFLPISVLQQRGCLCLVLSNALLSIQYLPVQVGDQYQKKKLRCFALHGLTQFCQSESTIPVSNKNMMGRLKLTFPTFQVPARANVLESEFDKQKLHITLRSDLCERSEMK